MRISDWSSDVCSSDLRRRRRRWKAGAGPSEVRLHAELAGPAIFFILQQASAAGAFLIGDIGLVEAVHEFGEDLQVARDSILAADVELEVLETGRESCRERVCQYV